MSFFLLSTCTEELISTPKIIEFQQNHVPTENFFFLSNPTPYSEYLYSLLSIFFVDLTAPSKQLPNVE